MFPGVIRSRARARWQRRPPRNCFPPRPFWPSANPGQKLNVAAIGCGGRGLYMQGLNPELNYVALAEPDQGNLAKALKNLAGGAEKAKREGLRSRANQDLHRLPGDVRQDRTRRSTSC